MRTRRSLALAVLLLAGCGRAEDGQTWKSKYLKELAYHQQTMAIKNAEIAVRDLEIENQKQFMQILTDRIAQLEKKTASLPAPEPGRPLRAKITAIASEIGLLVVNAGADDGLVEGELLLISRAGKPVARLLVQRVDRKWAAGQVRDPIEAPQGGDDVTRP